MTRNSSPGTGGLEDGSNGSTAVPGGMIQRRSVETVHDVDIGLGGNQQFNGYVEATFGGGKERSDAVGGPGINVGPSTN